MSLKRQLLRALPLHMLFSRKKNCYLYLFSTFIPGGAEIRSCHIINSMAPDSHHVIVPLDGKDSCKAMLNSQVDVEIIKSPEGKICSELLLWIYHLIREEKPSLVLTYNWGASDAIWISRVAGIKHIIHHEDGFNADEAYQQKSRRLWFRRFVFGLANKIVVPSQKLAAIGMSKWWLSSEKIAYIPNGIDTRSFYPPNGKTSSFRKRLGIDENQLIMGAVTGLRKEKNLDFLINVLARLKDKFPVKLIIVGGGPERDLLVQLARNLAVEDRVIFTGHIKSPTQYFQIMDLYAISSDTEQMPISLLEAMSTGLPVISTDVGDVKQMVSAENRDFVIERGDEEAYLNKLKILLQNPSLRKSLGKDNRKVVCERYTIEEQIQRYLELYKEVLSTT